LGSAQPGGVAVRPTRSEHEALFLTLDRRGPGAGRLTDSGLYEVVRKTGEGAGVRTRPHGLRHLALTTAVEVAAQQGIPLLDVLEFSGHRGECALAGDLLESGPESARRDRQARLGQARKEFGRRDGERSPCERGDFKLAGTRRRHCVRRIQRCYLEQLRHLSRGPLGVRSQDHTRDPDCLG